MKRVAQLMIACLAWFHVGAANDEASVEGTVRLPKAPPPVSPAKYANKIQGEVGPPAPPAAVVYLEGNFGHSTNIAKAQMEQKRFQFAPGILPIQTGTA